MRSIRLGELRELLHGTAFTAWFTEWSRAAAEVRQAAERHQDLASQAALQGLRSELAQRAAMDAFSDGGVAEEAQARLSADAQELENRALELVGLHEEQRDRTSALWYRLGGLERTLEEASGPEARLAVERQLPALRQEYAAEDERRRRLWTEVEETWARSFERSLLAQEHGERARRTRKEAERLFLEAEERRQRARQLEAEAATAAREESAARQRGAQLLDRASRELGCVHGERFLYWRQGDDPRLAFAVPLLDEVDGAGPAVKALSIHSVGPLRGVAHLEPAREGAAPGPGEGDRRFEEYLRGPRPAPRREGGGAGADDPGTP